MFGMSNLLIAKASNSLEKINNSSWACNYTQVDTGFLSAGNMSLGDGTYVCDMDINNQRPFPGFPAGAHVSVLTGTFNRSDKCHFTIVATAVGLTLQSNPGNIPQETWQPFARLKDTAEMTIVDNNTLKGTRTVSFYDYFDITLTKRLIDPNTGLPVPDIVQTVICKRVS
jgi:hypothetical protein